MQPIAVVAGACALGMLLSGCGGSGGDSNASGGANVITAFNSEPQNALIPGDTNETGGGKVGRTIASQLTREGHDITVIDPDTILAVDKQRFYSKGKNTPYQGRLLSGWPLWTLVAGKVVMAEREIKE